MSAMCLQCVCHMSAMCLQCVCHVCTICLQCVCHVAKIFQGLMLCDDRESLTPEKPAMQSCRDFVLAAASPASKDALSPSRPHLFSWHCSALYQSRFNFLSKFKKTFIARVSYHFRCEIRQWRLT